tara:strand:+ start:39 stop:521 length:483 start_codon:yes stop_codon:yes gene_type:complete
MCSQALANFFIEKANEEKINITNMQLQKLMFIGYGWTLSLTGNDLTDEEGFEAWQHGPVIPSIYHELKHHGDRSITNYATDYDLIDNIVYIPKIKTQQNKLILDKVWSTYKNFNAWSLRDLTHQNDTPWKQVYKQGISNIKIDSTFVNQYYAKYLNDLLG